MAETIWLSHLFMSSKLVQFVGPVYLEDRQAEALRTIERHQEGLAINAVDALTEFAGKYRDKFFKKLPDVFTAGGIACVSAKCANVLSGFDLGTGGLLPVKMFQYDQKTEIPGEFLFLNLGAQKNALVPEQSPGVRKPWAGKDIYRITLALSDTSEPDQVAFTRNALSGPDLWVDPRLDQSVLLSDRLVQALRNAGLAKQFGLIKCRVTNNG